MSWWRSEPGYLHPCYRPGAHSNDVIMSTTASQITSLTIDYSTVLSGVDQRKHQSSASLGFVRGIHRWPVNSPHKGPVTQKMFPFNDVIMIYMSTTEPRHLSVLLRIYAALLLALSSHYICLSTRRLKTVLFKSKWIIQFSWTKGYLKHKLWLPIRVFTYLCIPTHIMWCKQKTLSLYILQTQKWDVLQHLKWRRLKKTCT